jgi:DNA-binding transcriptional LysR family regulator
MNTNKSDNWMRGLSDVDIRRLHVFMTVADRHGISNARADLNLGTSAISRYIKEIEEKIGLRLCNRGRAGFELTKEGHRVYELAKQLLGAIDDFRMEVSALHEQLVGTLRIACIDNLGVSGAGILASSIRSFAAGWPGMRVEVDTLPPNKVLQRVLDGYYHVGISYRLNNDFDREAPSLNYQVLSGEKLDWYCGHGHELFDMGRPSVAIDSINDFEWALGGYSHRAIELLDGLGARCVLRENTIESRLIVILAGQYIGRVPVLIAQPHVEAGDLKPVSVPESLQFPQNEIIAINPTRSSSQRAARLFMEQLTRAFSTST